MLERDPGRGLLLVLAAAAFASPASALGPVDVEVAAMAGGGTNPSYPPSFLGFGAGGRAGASIHGLYLGASGLYYAGGTATLPTTASFVDHAHTALLGGQAGYTFGLGVLRVRPLLELGIAELTEAGDTTSALYLQPGFTILVPVGPMFVGFDANGLLLPSYARPCPGCAAPATSFVGFTVHGQVGVRF